MSALKTSLDQSVPERLTGFFEPRAKDVDAGTATVREGLQFLGGLGLLPVGVYGNGPSSDLARMAEIIATIARSDMSSAFSLWCHRMAIEYLSNAQNGSPLRTRTAPRLLSGDALGSTALAGALGNYLNGTPVPVTYTRDGDNLVLNGRIVWASNLQPPFLAVTCAAEANNPGNLVIVALTEETPGLQVDPYPNLLALQATSSSSIKLENARVGPDAIVTEDCEPFVKRILSTFMLLQGSFCCGIAERSLEESAKGLDGTREILRPDYESLRARFEDARDRLFAAAGSADRLQLSTRDMLRLRLDWSSIATESVHLELKIAGGRGYVRTSATARRLREVSFLPIQSPTEIQLRWALQRFA